MTIRFGKRFWLLGVCAAMAAIPVASHAKQDAMDTCIQAFVAEQLPQGAPQVTQMQMRVIAT